MWKRCLVHPFFWVLVICSSAVLSASLHYHQPEGTIVHNLNSDAQGYYAYLPTAFIYSDWSYDYYIHVAEGYGKEYTMPPFLNGTDYGFVNKYYCGAAILQMPFFGLAMLHAHITATPVDGFSPVFTLWMRIGAWTWLMVGMWALFAWIKETLGQQIAAVVLVWLFLGTNLFYFTAFEFMLAHVYAFSLIAIFCLAVHRAAAGRANYHWLAAACGGLLFVLRPTDTLVALAIPFIAGSRERLQVWWLSLINRFRWLAAIPIAMVPIGIQCMAYKAQTGEWWIYSYGGEGFDFLQPHFWQVLFGWRVGLFVYAPLLLLSLAGIVVHRKNPFAAGMWVLFILLNTWVISSWWAWHYEGTFGMRPYIDFLPLFALPIGWFLVRINKKVRYSVLVASVFFVYLAQFQAWQRFEVMIPWSHMNWDKYATLFLEKNPKYRWVFSQQDFYPLPVGTDSLSTSYWVNGGWQARFASSSFSGVDESGVVLWKDRLPKEKSLLQLDIQGRVRMDPTVADAFVMMIAYKDGKEQNALSRKLLSYASADNTDGFFFFNPTADQWGSEADSVVIVLRNYADAHITFTDLRLVEAWQTHEKTSPHSTR